MNRISILLSAMALVACDDNALTDPKIDPRELPWEEIPYDFTFKSETGLYYQPRGLMNFKESCYGNISDDN